MAVKNFTLTDNQATFEEWQKRKLNDISEKSLVQYKCGALALDDVMSGTFSDLTVEEVQQAIENRPTKKQHIKTFVLDLFLYGLVDLSLDVIRLTVDDRTKLLIEKIIIVHGGTAV